MRMLLFPSDSHECLAQINKLLDSFCKGCITLYSKGFLSCNVHNVLHLVNDYKLYGSLDLISCFGFESFLGKLKNCVQSGYKPLQQVAFSTWHENDKTLQNLSDDYGGASNTFYSMHRAGQRCFELLALIGSPQLSFSKVFPAEQTSWPNWQTLWACTEADA